MTRPVLYAELNGVDSLVSGYRSRDFFEQVRGRAPMYVSQRRGWSCQESTARDIVALAESLGHDVVITGSRASRSSSEPRTLEVDVDELRARLDVDHPDNVAVHHEADGSLW